MELLYAFIVGILLGTMLRDRKRLNIIEETQKKHSDLVCFLVSCEHDKVYGGDES